MNKKSLILLPVLMAVLASCGGNTSDDKSSNTSDDKSSSEVPVEKSSLQIAYEAAELLENKAVSEAYTFEGTVAAKNGSSYFVVKGDYGIYVYYDKNGKSMKLGDEVSVTATLTIYSGLIETKSVASSTVTGEGTVPAATTVTNFDELSALKQNVLVDLVVTMPEELPSKAWAPYVDKDNKGYSPIVECTLGEDIIKVKLDKEMYSEANNAIYTASAGKQLTIKNAIATTYDYSGSSKAVNQVLAVASSTISIAG